MLLHIYIYIYIYIFVYLALQINMSCRRPGSRHSEPSTVINDELSEMTERFLACVCFHCLKLTRPQN